MSQKVIGIYLPTHNRLELLKKAIDSVCVQTYPHFKLMVIDDGSSDGTHEYLKSLADPRISFIRNDTPQKACKARNKAINVLDTELVTGLDDDDVFLPNRLESLLKAYDEEFAFVCSGYYWDYGAHKKALFSTDKKITLSDAFDLNQCSNQVLVNRQRVLAVGGFDESLPALQDHDLWVRLIAKYGAAYRVGNPSYIVNDDKSLERISTVTNKVNAIALFEKKHLELMSKRNRRNLLFYKEKIENKKFGTVQLIKSIRHGLFDLKIKHYLSQLFQFIYTLRLQYLRTGNVFQALNISKAKQFLVPLLATGGPGASRFLLLSACIYFLGAAETGAFSGDFFIIMLLNMAFSQSFGFFLLKPDYEGSFKTITQQSLAGLAISLCVLISLWHMHIITELIYSLGLLIALHFYYIYRFYNIANKKFTVLAIAEVAISLLCLFIPYALKGFTVNLTQLPYQIYLSASLVGLIIVFVFTKVQDKEKQQAVSFNKVKNIAISTTSSIFAVFILPTVVKMTSTGEIVSIVALTISTMSIAMLLPRTYANKILSSLASAQLKREQLLKIGVTYGKLVVLCAVMGLLFTLLYLQVAFSPQQYPIVFFSLPIGVCIMLISAQMGFVNLTYLSLHGKDGYVAKINTFQLLALLLLCMSLASYVTNFYLVYFVIFISSVLFIIRNRMGFSECVNTIKE